MCVKFGSASFMLDPTFRSITCAVISRWCCLIESKQDVQMMKTLTHFSKIKSEEEKITPSQGKRSPSRQSQKEQSLSMPCGAANSGTICVTYMSATSIEPWLHANASLCLRGGQVSVRSLETHHASSQGFSHTHQKSVVCRVIPVLRLIHPTRALSI